jgi:hypothetical protein
MRCRQVCESQNVVLQGIGFESPPHLLQLGLPSLARALDFGELVDVGVMQSLEVNAPGGAHSSAPPQVHAEDVRGPRRSR